MFLFLHSHFLSIMDALSLHSPPMTMASLHRLEYMFWYLMQTKELDMLIIHMGMELIIHVGMELNLHKTLCHFLVAQLQDLEPNVSRKH
ncbi:hypothetical protein I3842_09G170400 [Carya illinoinensis]|uniref:Uncharacterized protein n=1 Tax=Carya illinoinensis TaxID=32201 RepID=A0A922J6U1_CARIL|nr:hypothetical protein I3842_09G170400 [Carya illinoinensis]